MTIGDPKKAIVLAIVALVIIAVAVFRGAPSTPPAQALRTVASPASQKSAAKVDSTIGLTVDSFSHPNLGQESPAAKRSAQERQQSSPAEDRPPRSLSGHFPVVPEVANADPGFVGPPKNAGISQQEEKAAPFGSVKLEAIVRADSALAVLRVGSGSSAPLPEGAFIGERLRLMRIKEMSVVVELDGKAHEIKLGQEISL